MKTPKQKYISYWENNLNEVFLSCGILPFFMPLTFGIPIAQYILLHYAVTDYNKYFNEWGNGEFTLHLLLSFYILWGITVYSGIPIMVDVFKYQEQQKRYK